MKNLSVLILLVILTACGKESVTTVKGDKGDTGAQGYGAGIETASIEGLCGATDGVRLTTYQDKNNNGLRDTDEAVNSVTSVCNGSNGTNGTNGTNGSDGLNGINGTNGTSGTNGTNGTSSTVTVSNTALSCGAAGGYTLTTTNGSVSSSFPICNGAQGSQGIQGNQGNQGAQGIQGVAGLNGTNGSVVTPVKLCANDNSTYPEYGLYIGNDLYAVYWGSTPASSAAQAFLTKLVAGSYRSTGGNNCAFTVDSHLNIH